LCTRPLIHHDKIAHVPRLADDSGLFRHAWPPMQHPRCSARPRSERPLLAQPQDERDAADRRHDHARGYLRTVLATFSETLASHPFLLLEHA